MGTTPRTLERACYTFCSDDAGADAWAVTGLSIRERLNEPFLAVIDLASEAEGADPTLLLGQNATVRIVRGEFQRTLLGIVEKVQSGARRRAGAGTTTAASTRVHVVPALSALRNVFDTRVFQANGAGQEGPTVPEILTEVLGEALGTYGRSVTTTELAGTYPQREICMQYQESTFDFVHRLMEEEGIGYRFTFDGAVEEMVLTDRNQAFPEVQTASEGVLAVVPVGALPEVIQSFLMNAQLVSTSTVVRTFDWSAPSVPHEHAVRTTDTQNRDREVYDHGRELRAVEQSGATFAPTDEERQATLRSELQATHARVGRGTGSVTGFCPGTKIRIAGHDDPALDGDYILTEVTHRDAETTGPGTDYTNEFECIPLEVPWRPPRRHRPPHVDSVQTAQVVGPSGQEIYTDGRGRIRVQFEWDRQGVKDDHSMCWVRVSQRWAGTGWGFQFLPRIGMEVIVTFIDGCADRPLVVGCLYNGVNVPPYTLPAEKTKSTIKTRSSIGGWGFNELRFEDDAGNEEIFLHAQKDLNEHVLNDHNTHVANNQTNAVDVDQTQTVHVDQVEQVDGDQTMTVSSGRTVHVLGKFTETIDSGETRTVTGGHTETISGGLTRTVNGGSTETINGNEIRTINDGQTETINGNLDLTITGAVTHTVNGPRTRTVMGGITEEATGAYELVANAGSRFVYPGGYTVVSPGGQTRVDKRYDLIGGRFFVNFQDHVDLQATLQIAFAIRLCVRGLDTRTAALKSDTVGLLFKREFNKLSTGAAVKCNIGASILNAASILYF